MFPYRRNGPKKRGKGPHNRRHRDGGGGGGRIPGSAADLLSALQPTTKALAQMLAGNTKQSGQLAHARNMLGQAQRLIEERQVERMPPAIREEFLEQVARLRLTLADADELDDGDDQEAQPRTAPNVGRDQLREVALRLARSEPAPLPPLQAPVHEPIEEPPPPVEREPAPSGRGERIRLKAAQPDDFEVARKPPRERLRLKPLGSTS